MQMRHIQELVAKLKENSDIQVETTTLGKFLGARGDRLAMTLGKGVLSRPILVNTSVESLQIIDLESGFVLTLKNFEDVLPKLLDMYSSPNFNKPKEIAVVGGGGPPHIIPEKMILKTEFSSQLLEINRDMQKPDSVEKKMKLVEKTIFVLENQKSRCEDGEHEKLAKAQQKLENLMRHSKEKRLAPGQIPSVFEITIWFWIN